MPLMETSGNVTADAYAGGVAVKAKYIEDYFSTWLRTGTGASATVTTGLDASTNKALVWTKSRSAATDHKLTDTVRGATKALISNTTGAQTTDTNGLTAFSTTGYTIGSDTNYNNSGATYVDWEFVATPKFFDVVTYTGNGSSTQTINHNLGSAPGCIIIKVTSQTDDWYVYHRSLSQSGGVPYWLNLNSTAAQQFFGGGIMLSADPTSTTFTVKGGVNGSGNTYVAYLFAHDAGGFGLNGTDNVISCGSFTTDGSSNATIDLGYEPQWVLTKRTNGSGAWGIYDTMRGWSYTAQNYLLPNDSGAEGTINAANFHPTATGFTVSSPYDASATYIYIAIRRGPMKVPTDATKVFSPVAYTGSGSGATGQTITAGFPIDLASYRYTNQAFGGTLTDRLRGFTGTSSKALYTYATAAEATDTEIYGGDSNTGIKSYGFSSSYNFIGWYWRRAPSFMDVVCYTGTGSARTINHNLGVVPELMIVKSRDRGTGGYWWVYSASLLASEYLELDGNYAKNTATTMWNDTRPTSSVFSVGTITGVNASSSTFVAYLFATCAGVSKVGSYTGNGTTQTIDCGFTGGARFVLIKRTDSTGDWYVYDTARGMTTLTDPYLFLNSDAAQSATLGSVTTVSTGFAVNASILAAINTNAASYIFLAIA